MEQRRSAGGIVIGDKGTLAIVKSRNGNGCFFFPKGHLHTGETDEEAARREITEETGLLDLEYIADLGIYERPSLKYNGVTKPIHMYLFATAPRSILIPGSEIATIQWAHYQKMVDLFAHPTDRSWYMGVFNRVREAIQRD